MVRDINKYSNNVMTQQVFLTWGCKGGAGSFEAARDALQRWWRQRLGGDADLPVVDNGAGLSREARISAQAWRMLQLAWAARSCPSTWRRCPSRAWTVRCATVPAVQAGAAHTSRPAACAT